MPNRPARPAAAIAAAVVTAGMLAAAPAAAQSDAGPVSDAVLDKYVTAYVAMREMARDYRDSVSDIEDQEKLAEIRERYEERMAETVREEGLTPSRYQEIFRAAQSDPELRARAQELIEARTGDD